MIIVNETFTSVRAGGGILVLRGEEFTYQVSNTFVGKVVLEFTTDGGQSYSLI